MSLDPPINAFPAKRTLGSKRLLALNSSNYNNALLIAVQTVRGNKLQSNSETQARITWDELEMNLRKQVCTQRLVWEVNHI